MGRADASATEPLVGSPAAQPPLSPHGAGLSGQRDGAAFIGPQPAANKGTGPPLMAFTSFPLWLREGPWKLGATLYIPTLVTFVVLLAPCALDTRPSYPGSPSLEASMRPWPCACALAWTALVLAYMFATTGSWPMISFTMMSWTMLVLRFACILGGAASPALWLIGEALRGPALLNSIFLAAVWWLALVPLITYFSKDAQARTGFLRFNCSFFLINVHALNVGLGLLSHRLAPRPLLLFDLWTTLAFSAMYVLGYLFLLDPRGIHLYIILSPRSHFAPVVYSALLGAQLGLYSALGGSFDLVAGSSA
jgi:hypothetical protein